MFSPRNHLAMTGDDAPTVVVFGTGSHPVLGAIYEQLQVRARRRVIFAPLESFPSGIQFSLHQADGDCTGSLRIEGDSPVAFENIISVCLDGYAILAGGEGLSEEDQQYRQTESWAALVAFFHNLSRHSLVANHIVKRDHFHSRLSELSLLHSYGLPVARLLVTSDARQARAFIEEVGSVLYRSVMGRDIPFRQLQPQDVARLEEVGLAPVHFEEAPSGAVVGCTLVGSRLLISPRDADIPRDIQTKFRELCAELGLHLAELRVHYTSQRGWTVVGLHPFLSQEGIQDPEVMTATLEMLETGLEAS